MPSLAGNMIAPEEGFCSKVQEQNLQLLPHPGHIFSDQTWRDGTSKIKSTNKTINWEKSPSKYFQSCSEGTMSVLFFCIFTLLEMQYPVTWLCIEHTKKILTQGLSYASECPWYLCPLQGQGYTDARTWDNSFLQSYLLWFSFSLPPCFTSPAQIADNNMRRGWEACRHLGFRKWNLWQRCLFIIYFLILNSTPLKLSFLSSENEKLPLMCAQQWKPLQATWLLQFNLL